MIFFDSDACRCGLHCATCRKIRDGRTFRTVHPYEMPAEGPDFECPPHRGAKPWGYTLPVIVTAPAARIRASTHRQLVRPGDLVEWMLLRLGYEKKPNCGCEAFRHHMNELGWRGCWRHRAAIVAWFAAKAREQGIEVDDEKINSLLLAGMKDIMRRRKVNPSQP
jgi:hypothetical protein